MSDSEKGLVKLQTPAAQLSEVMDYLRDEAPDSPVMPALQRIHQSLMSGGDVADMRERVNNFTRLINRTPNAKWVKRDTSTGDYLPISHIEAQLDRMFYGQWWTENLQVGQIANEVWVAIDVVVLHPTSGLPIRRGGIAAIPIQQAKGAELTDALSTKIKNALQKNLPTAKAIAFKNAVKSLGKRFGRDIARKHEDHFVPLSSAPAGAVNE